jgi:hypothetical protein
MGNVRECRLRAEFEHLYEGIPSGRWYPAADLADRLVMRARRARMLKIHQRTFDPRHFEFRGGAEGEPRWPGSRTRSSDADREPR